MLQLFKIEFHKLRYSKTFWVITGLYIFLIIAIPISVVGFLEWVKAVGGDIDGFDPMKIPVLYFPDVWQNLTFIYGFLRIFMGILVIISVSNEYTYRTVRQNIIDGLSRKDFIASKLIAFFVISLVVTIIVFFTALISGLLATPEILTSDVLDGFQFIGAFFLNLFTYMALALLLTIAIQRTGLSIAIILLITSIEYIIGFNLPDSIDFLNQYLPMHAMENLIPMPFTRYAFREIQDYVSPVTVLVVLIYLVLFIYASYRRLKSTDL